MRRSMAAIVLAGACAVPAWGQVSFSERAEFGARPTLTVAWADFDQDGDLDLAVGNAGGVGNELYVNQGNGTFVQRDEFGAGNTFCLVWGDFDNDGDPDMAVGNGGAASNMLYVNNGDGTFTGHAEFGANRTVGMAWADFDLDGDLDLAVGNGILGVAEQNYLYVNNGNGTFTQLARFAAGQTDSVAWADANGDGYPDLAVGNGGFSSSQQNILFLNNAGNGNFTTRIAFGAGDTSAIAWADEDNDGDFDLGVMNWDGGQSMLYLNNGAATFSGQAQFGIGDPNSLAWGDFDFDGDLDLAQGNGDFTSAAQNLLWVNGGGGAFASQAQFGLGSTDAIAWGDADGDGDLDAAAGNEHSPTQNYLYTNQSVLGGSVAISTRGHFHDHGAGYSNRDGVGAELRFYEGGFVGDPAHFLGLRQVDAQGGFAPQNEHTLRFGLGSRASVDVRIKWPGSGGSRIVQDVVELQKGAAVAIDESPTTIGPGEARSLTLSRPPGSVDPPSLTLRWNASCSGGAADYAIYEGTLGSWYSHTLIDCSDDGADRQETLTPSAGNRYYLVVPENSASEGSYGTASHAVERPAGSAACRAGRIPTTCP